MRVPRFYETTPEYTLRSAESIPFAVLHSWFRSPLLHPDPFFSAEDEISEILKKHGNPKTLNIKKIPYRRYKRTSDVITNTLNELIFTIEK